MSSKSITPLLKKQKSEKSPKKRYDPSKKKVKSPQKALQTCSDLGMRVKFQTEKFKNGWYFELEN